MFVYNVSMERSDSVDNFLDKLMPDAVKDDSRCINCGQSFSEKNVFTEAGWRETKISHCCEKCFDAIVGDDE